MPSSPLSLDLNGCMGNWSGLDEQRSAIGAIIAIHSPEGPLRQSLVQNLDQPNRQEGRLPAEGLQFSELGAND